VSAWIENPQQRGGQGTLGVVYQENIDIYTYIYVYMYIYNVECTSAYGNKLF